jgi:peptide/nickel transport system permease protein
MQSYIIKRLILFIPTLVLVTVIIFLVLRIVPGDPALMIVAGENEDYSEEQLEKTRKDLGLDKPIHVQYGVWVWGMLRGDFGTSFFWRSSVSDDLKERLPITLELTILALLIATMVAVPLGVLSAIKQDTIGDYIGRVITIAGIALPNFWVGIMMIFFLVLWFEWIPPLGYVDLWEEPGKNIQQIVFPALALSFSNMAFIARITRSAMLEVFREDYIRTARSKGLTERVVISRHALRNALLPVVTVSGYEFGRLLAGTVIIETIFLVPGMGRLLVDSVLQRDYAVIQAVVVIVSIMVLVLNMVLDVLYAWLNPRIRYS